MAYEEQEFTQSFELSTWKRLLPFLRPYRTTLLVILI